MCYMRAMQMAPRNTDLTQGYAKAMAMSGQIKAQALAASLEPEPEAAEAAEAKGAEVSAAELGDATADRSALQPSAELRKEIHAILVKPEDSDGLGIAARPNQNRVLVSTTPALNAIG